MSTAIKAALTTGHAPRKVIDSPVVKAFITGATDEDYAADYKLRAAKEFADTLSDLGFNSETIDRMVARRYA